MGYTLIVKPFIPIAGMLIERHHSRGNALYGVAYRALWKLQMKDPRLPDGALISHVASRRNQD